MIWIIAAASIAGILIRPFRTPEWVWAVAGAVLLLVCGLESSRDALRASGDGTDVYFFLLGMMILSELAREEGVFDWLAGETARRARGSSVRLFTLIYLIGIVVTAFMSNDATAVVLTPAVYACMKKAGARPKPSLFACALIANAASFLLPISNPANLVVYGKNLPGLGTWVTSYFFPSVVSIAVTYGILRLWFRRELRVPLDAAASTGRLRRKGVTVLCGLGFSSVVLLACSSLQVNLGLPTLAAALLVLAVVSWGSWPAKLFKNLSWSVVPLVAGLFIIVDAVNRAGALHATQRFFEWFSAQAPLSGRELAAFSVGLISNLVNNLPVGLTAGLAAQSPGVSEVVRRGILIGVDLGPNLSVTGSLATILWLMAIRREGESVSAFEFFLLGCVCMPLSLFAAVAVS